MLLQRALCRSLPKQFPDPPQCLWPRTMQRNTLFRSFRSSPHRRNPQPASSVHAPHAPPPFENVIFGGSVPPRNIVKALLFTGVFTAGCFAGATILEYENTRNMMLEKARQTKFPWLRRKINASNELTVWEEIRNELQTFWSTLTPGGKVFVPLCALNVLVFALWRVPSMRPTMLTYFCSNPAGRAVCWPMFLSTFSHYSMFHIFANMYVLNSFANAAVLSMGKEQFLAVYLSGGVIASFASILYKAATAQAGLSIGASGAIMAIFAYVCAKYPDTQLNILFLPMVTFSAGAAMKVLMGFDLAGCILGWKFFDHAAHLGGALYGIFWAYFGTELWQKRVPFLTMYHDFRKTK